MMNDAAGYQFFIETIQQHPFYCDQMIRFLQDRFPELQSYTEGTMVGFLQEKKGTALAR